MASICHTNQCIWSGPAVWEPPQGGATGPQSCLHGNGPRDDLNHLSHIQGHGMFTDLGVNHKGQND